MPRWTPYDWTKRHPYFLDGAIVVVLALASSPYVLDELFSSYGLSFRGMINAGLTAGLILPLLYRRRYPVEVFTIISLTCFAQILLLDNPLASDVAFLLALYALAAYAQRRVIAFAGLAVGGLASLLAAVDWRGQIGLNGLMANALFFFVFVLLTWTLGDLMRTRRAYIAGLEERARRLEHEKEQETQLARSAERARIARELHDVVAHSLSIVVAQADGGLYASEADPKEGRRALETIGATGRRALTEMRRLLGVWKSDAGPADPDYVPQPGLDQLADLVAQVREGGIDVGLSIEGERPAELADGIELAAYRIVQESLTNVLKHAGPRVHAEVFISYDETRLNIRVADDGRGAAAPNDGAGHGLEGMRARVAVYNGTLDAAPRRGGGFEVRAKIPFT